MCSFSLHAYRGKQNRYRMQETLRNNKAVSKRHFYSSVLLSIPSVSLFSIIKCKPQNHFIFSNESLSFTCKSNISTFPGPWWKWLHSNIDVLIYIYILEVVDDGQLFSCICLVGLLNLLGLRSDFYEDDISHYLEFFIH